MTEQQHCPGFESNKSLNEVKVKCPDCGAEIEIFSDELEKKMKCSSCGTQFTAKKTE